jgi:hypothetical protein
MPFLYSKDERYTLVCPRDKRDTLVCSGDERDALVCSGNERDTLVYFSDAQETFSPDSYCSEVHLLISAPKLESETK